MLAGPHTVQDREETAAPPRSRWQTQGGVSLHWYMHSIKQVSNKHCYLFLTYKLFPTRSNKQPETNSVLALQCFPHKNYFDKPFLILMQPQFPLNFCFQLLHANRSNKNKYSCGYFIEYMKKF